MSRETSSPVKAAVPGCANDAQVRGEGSLSRVDWSCDDLLLPESHGELASQTLSVNELIQERRRNGQEVFACGFGKSPFPIPECVVKELIKHAHANEYLPVQGLRELREAVVDFFDRNFGLAHFSPDHVMVAPGSKLLLQHIITVLDAEVILSSPMWVTYYPQAVFAGKRIRIVQTTAASNWMVTPRQIEELCKEDVRRRRLLILNYPNNPTGTTLSEKDCRELAPVLRKYNVAVLADEIYALFWHHNPHVSLAKFYPSHTIVCSGLSKVVGAGGWRLGFAAIPEELSFLLPALRLLGSNSFSCAPAPIQYAAISALRKNDEVDEYLRLCRMVLAPLCSLLHKRLEDGGVSVVRPQGAFYMFLDFHKFASRFAANGWAGGAEMTKQLLMATGVAVVDATAFTRRTNTYGCRFCVTDFDGAVVLEAAARLDDKPVEEEFLRKYCGRTFGAVDAIVSWLQSL